MRFIVFLIFLSAFSNSQPQQNTNPQSVTTKFTVSGLQLADIFKIYSIDSTALKKFCTEKKFNLQYIEEEDWGWEYTYKSMENEKVSFRRLFPNGNSAFALIQYYFDNKKEYKNFKDSVKARSFNLTERNNQPINNDGNKITYEKYVNDRLGLEIELSEQNFGKSKYSLTLTKYFKSK